MNTSQNQRLNLCYNIVFMAIIVINRAFEIEFMSCTGLMHYLEETYSRTSMARTPLEPLKYVRDRVARASVDNSARSGSIIGICSIFSNMIVCCVFSLAQPHRGDSNEYTQYTIFNIKKKITVNYPKSAYMRFSQGTQERL